MGGGMMNAWCVRVCVCECVHVLWEYSIIWWGWPAEDWPGSEAVRGMGRRVRNSPRRRRLETQSGGYLGFLRRSLQVIGGVNRRAGASCLVVLPDRWCSCCVFLGGAGVGALQYSYP